LAFGLGFTLPYFLLESILGGILGVISFGTHNDLWTNITTYFLGKNLSALSTVLLPPRGLDILSLVSGNTSVLGSTVDATHALLVTLAYFALFVGVTGYLTWKRDVLQ
jgi:hypothetical protein